ncbi:transcriptional regulator, LuxR family [Cohaesibacter sp. ES.047]|uniref:LuxR family transcriptional regulator n=1 Tax=Cohaesibacter sp. ES.047 TaxID=1798205 RepID=UPI000BB73C5A|nr:LuxR family transcriptional regulator [Cohaesibacter sp. ES.047]SNY93107.1 transcriptional regulator, LuxR family [Cohaesibacter sp. ES.047]
MSILNKEALINLYPGIALEDAMQVAQVALEDFGFDVSTYDFSPVPLTYEGKFIFPTVYDMRNAPSDMVDLWCAERYYEQDPVMDASREITRPFTWTYDGRQSDVMERILDDRHQPVINYLCDTGMRCGITVPIRCPDGALATFTAMSTSRIDNADLDYAVSSVGYLAHALHDAVIDGFEDDAFLTPHVSLTKREQQCLALCGQGLTAKEIAHHIDRSIPTVTLHLTSATKKLGARNRFQALVMASHYRLLETSHRTH